MPRGHYKRKPWNSAEGSADCWLKEHDTKLVELLDAALSFSQIRPIMLAAFPGRTWSRNAILGRAHRKGFKSKVGKNGRVGMTELRSSKPRKVKNQEGYQRKDFVKRALAPVVMKAKPALLRDESDRGACNSEGKRVLNYNDPVVVERRKGNLPAIIEERPLTSVAIVDCDRGSCMWPTSEDITCLEVCGEPTEIGAYCARHGTVAYRVMPTSRRNGTRHKEDKEYARRIDGSHHRDELDRDGEWLGRMIMEEIVTAPADEPPLMIPQFLEHKV